MANWPMNWNVYIQQSDVWTKLLVCCRQHFQMLFLEKNSYFDTDFFELYFGGPIYNEWAFFWVTAWCQTSCKLLPELGWVGLWDFLWWALLAKGKDHHGVSSGWSSVWHRSNTGLFSTQYEQIPIILGVWQFCLTPFFFRSITFWRAFG